MYETLGSGGHQNLAQRIFEQIKTFLDGYSENVVTGYSAYSANSTYAVGDRVRYGDSVYECTTAITIAETWNAAHWQVVDPLQTQIDSLKSSVSSGKTLVAAAVTGKGVPTAATDSFATMASNIAAIPSGGGTPSLQNKTVVSNGVVTADSGYDGLGTVTVAIPVYDGSVEVVT